MKILKNSGLLLIVLLITSVSIATAQDIEVQWSTVPNEPVVRDVVYTIRTDGTVLYENTISGEVGDGQWELLPDAELELVDAGGGTWQRVGNELHFQNVQGTYRVNYRTKQMVSCNGGKLTFSHVPHMGGDEQQRHRAMWHITVKYPREYTIGTIYPLGYQHYTGQLTWHSSTPSVMFTTMITFDEDCAPSEVPEPATILLLSTGLLVLARKRKKSK